MIAHVKYLPHILVLAGGLALAGCGGSSDSGNGNGGGGGGNDPTDVSLSSVTTTDDEYVAPSAGTYPIAAGGTTTQGSITFSCASGGEACSVVVAANGDITSTGGTVTAANSAAFKLAMANAQEDKDTANIAVGKALYNVLNVSAGARGGTESLTSAGLAVNPVDISTTNDDDDYGSVTLKAGDASGSSGVWKGVTYKGKAESTATPADKGEYEALIYSNQGAAESKKFSEQYPTTETFVNDAGHITVFNPARLALIEATAFNHSGTKTHTPTGNQDSILINGTFNGASGQYKCTPQDGAPCTSGGDGKGVVSTLATGWTFIPGKDAMVSNPDAEYLYFGWWIRKDDKGMPTHAAVFRGDTLPDENSVDYSGAEETVATSGSATYKGKAIGKYAWRITAANTHEGGHFTADAALTAEFNTAATGTIEGTINNFSTEAGSRPWVVKLNEAPITSSDGTITLGTLGTTWSHNSNEADKSGSWNAQFYDEKPGTGDEGDGSNVPTTVVGQFVSEYESTGKMIGAFGANN